MTSKQIENRKKEIESRAIALNGGNYCGCAKYFTDADNRELAELDYRDMINTCLCYGEGYDIFNERTHTWGDTGLRYGFSKLGYERALEIWKEQKEFFERYARVTKCVFTDEEGCSYNNLDWVEDALPVSDFGKMQARNTKGELLNFTNYDIAVNEYGTEITMAKHTNAFDKDGNKLTWKEHAYKRLKPIWDMATDEWRYLMKVVCQRNQLDFPYWMK